VGHGLGLEHDLGLGVGPSYKPWGGCIRVERSVMVERNDE